MNIDPPPVPGRGTARIEKRYGRFVAGAILVGLVGVSCGGETKRFETPEVAGPGRIQMDVVQSHASSFDTEAPDRTAGSQQEQAAAGYLTGTLQQNGYFVRLDSVPVADVVRSTNIVAEPAGVEVPEIVVVVPYDVVPGQPNNGIELGIFLELARALNVEAPEHTVYFVALGAEHTEAGGGNLGSRRLAQGMLDDGWDPLVIQLVDLVRGESLAVSGDGADDVIAMLSASTGPFAGFDRGELSIEPDVFHRAGFRRMLVSGDPEKVGEVLLDYLRHFTR